jgi:hypothetical protein
MSQLQAIVRKTVIVSATYTDVPSFEERTRLKAQGAIFKNGNWVRNISESVIVDALEVPKHFAA